MNSSPGHNIQIGQAARKTDGWLKKSTKKPPGERVKVRPAAQGG
jgi:hypothetical protein